MNRSAKGNEGDRIYGRGGVGRAEKMGGGSDQDTLARVSEKSEGSLSQGNASFKNYLLESTFCIYPRYAQMDFIMLHRSIRNHMQLSNIMNGIDFQLLSNLKN